MYWKKFKYEIDNDNYYRDFQLVFRKYVQKNSIGEKIYEKQNILGFY